MSIRQIVKNYITNNNFVPHTNGNSMHYGLNEFGCNSVILYNNQIWKFIWFINNSNNAVYINKEGDEFVLNDINYTTITRMMVQNND